MDVDGLEREPLRRRRREARERARDRVQPVDFGQDSPGRLRERRVEVPAVLLLARALQVLDAEADRGEGILDLVRDLTRHLAPGEHAGGAGEGGRVVERHDAAAPPRAQGRELHADLAPPQRELALHHGLGCAARAASRGAATGRASPRAARPARYTATTSPASVAKMSTSATSSCCCCTRSSSSSWGAARISWTSGDSERTTR